MGREESKKKKKKWKKKKKKEKKGTFEDWDTGGRTRGRGFRAVLPEDGAREAAFTSIRNLLPYPILKYRG